MRGDVVYRVYGVHEGREEDTYFGTFRTVGEAEAQIVKLRSEEMHGRSWMEQYHNRGFVIREAVVETDFEVPPRPKPRDRYFVRGRPKKYRPGTWDGTMVEVLRRPDGEGEVEKVCEYERNYALLETFEPFRQGRREFALISPDYTGTSVLDLATGRVIAEEPVRPDGFCPVGFYVPDWWDLHDSSIIPGSVYWNADREWPTGDFGFVWGCIWGDDSSWKVQLLDLSGITSGEIRREGRFGYLELASRRYRSPCIVPDVAPPPEGTDPPPFIKVDRSNGKTWVTFDVEMSLDFDSGEPWDWKRLKNSNFD